MIGAHVLVPMRLAPPAWAFGVIEKIHRNGKVDVAMPYKDHHLYQRFDKADVHVRPSTSLYNQFHERLKLKK